MAALCEAEHRRNFVKSFVEDIAGVDLQACPLDTLWAATKHAMQKAADALPQSQQKANQPWISDHTLHLLSLRRSARANNDYVEEQRLHKDARKSAKMDRGQWLDTLLKDGDWRQIRALRKPKRPKCSQCSSQFPKMST